MEGEVDIIERMEMRGCHVGLTLDPPHTHTHANTHSQSRPHAVDGSTSCIQTSTSVIASFHLYIPSLQPAINTLPRVNQTETRSDPADDDLGDADVDGADSAVFRLDELVLVAG